MTDQVRCQRIGDRQTAGKLQANCKQTASKLQAICGRNANDASNPKPYW